MCVMPIKDLGSGGHTYALDSFTSTMDSDISGPSARIGKISASHGYLAIYSFPTVCLHSFITESVCLSIC